MKAIAFAVLGTLLFVCGCASPAPASTPTPELLPSKAPVPTPTAGLSGTVMPELVIEFNNRTDPLKTPYGAALSSTGRLYVNDAGNSRVLVFSGAVLMQEWDQQGGGQGEFDSMGFGGIAVDANDNVFVVDNGNHRIQKFDAEGTFLTQWGSSGTGDGQFVRAIGIAMDTEGNVYVTDDGNPFVQKFDNNGTFLMKWGGKGTGDGQFNHATGIAVDSDGEVFVSDYENQRVQKFDAQGSFLTSWTLGTDLGVTGTPEGIAIDEQGRVYVTDYALGRIEVFDNEGQLLWVWGSDSLATPLFRKPTALVLDPLQNQFLVVNQGSSRIQIFNLPKQ